MLFLVIAILVLTLLLILTILFALQYFGLFDSIHVSTGSSPFPYGGRKIVYRIDLGQYKDSSPLFTEICSILPESNTFGVYVHKDHFDDSIRSKIPSERLSSIEYVFMIGAILPSSTDDPEQSLKPTVMKLLKENRYEFAQLPEQVDNVVYCKFPYRGIMSVVVASRRVYDAIDSYIHEYRLCAYPKIEIYDKDQIYFILPLSQQNQFIHLISNRLQADNIASAAANLGDSDGGSETNDNIEIVAGGGGGTEEDTETEPHSHHSDSAESNSSYELVD